jgi:sialate O-acetylesterase
VRVLDTGGGVGRPGHRPRLATVVGDVPLAGFWKARVAALSASIGVGHNDAPTLLYNGMLHALLPLRLRVSSGTRAKVLCRAAAPIAAPSSA